MRVIADLHGGDPEDIVAKAEFQEIKDRVIFEVREVFSEGWHIVPDKCSASPVKGEPMLICGDGISDGCCSLCHRRPLPSW